MWALRILPLWLWNTRAACNEGRFGPSHLGDISGGKVEIEVLSLGMLLTRLARECMSMLVPRCARACWSKSTVFQGVVFF